MGTSIKWNLGAGPVSRPVARGRRHEAEWQGGAASVGGQTRYIYAAKNWKKK